MAIFTWVYFSTIAHIGYHISLPYRLQGLRSPKPFIRQMSAYELGIMGQKAVPAYQSLVLALADNDQAVALAACNALSRHGKEVVPALLKAVRNRNPKVREYAVLLLAKHANQPKVVPRVLINALRHDSSTLVRRQAAYSLEFAGPNAPGVIRAFISALGDKDRELNQRKMSVPHLAARSLGRFGAKAREAIPALLRCLEEADPRICEAAACSLAQVGKNDTRVVPALIEALKKGKNQNAFPGIVFALGQCRKNAKIAVSGLLKAYELKCITQPNLRAYVRESVLDALGQIGEHASTVVPFLIRNCQDPNLPPTLRARAADALGKFGPAAKAAIPCLKRAVKGPDSELRLASARALNLIDR